MSEDLLFQPTCPRCSTICQSDSTYCAECGTRLMLTEREIEELREVRIVTHRATLHAWRTGARAS